jgi:CRISPR-associated endonuclease/helicase Cas3
MQITTLPVYSKLADPATVPPEILAKLPDGWQLSEHQLATYHALRDPDVDVVINTAMTGDGKSLAGLLPLFTAPHHNGTLALFPTNELITDQLGSAARMLPLWGRPADWVGALFGARLDELTAAADELSRAETLLRELNTRRLVLSNPDILHAILQFRYQQRGRTLTHVVGQLPLLFDQLTFDEFHIFETPQVVAVLTGLLFLIAQQPALKTLFLSATPDPEVLRLLNRAGFSERLRLIDPYQACWYHHGDDPGAGWRPILQGSAITFAPLSAEEWLDAGGEQTLLDWFHDHRPGARAALIVNSVATALRLVERLRPVFARQGLSVEPNTGITGRRVRADSFHADLLVGTSTVDVGVDFRINLLVFEAGSAGTFLQRLGRLGRHRSFRDRGGQEHQFEAFAAHALVPPFIYERLTRPEAALAAPLRDGASYTREQLGELIRAVFPQPARFDQYIRRWGRFVPARVIQTLSEKALRPTFANVREQLLPRYGALIQGRLGDALRDWREHQRQDESLLIEEAQSFRGSSPFACGLLKEDEGDVVSYDLFWLLANAHLELLSCEAFCAGVKRLGKSELPYRRKFYRFFFRWRGLRQQQEQVWIILPPEVARWPTERQQSAQVLPGIQIDCAGHEFVERLNRTLLAEPCVGLIIPAHEPRQVRRMRYLPPGLQLLPYRADSGDGGEQEGTIAFGRDALLLDSSLAARPLGDPPDTPMIY